MTIGMTLFAPMNYYDEDNNFVGFDTELANAVGEKLGIKINFIEINWDSKEIELNSKNATKPPSYHRIIFTINP